MSGAYAGDIGAGEAFRVLAEEPRAVLVDVRSRPEWSFVGLPDLTALGKAPLLVEWQRFPAMARNEGFEEELRAALGPLAEDHDAPLLFLCRSGARSAAAAGAMSGLGYRRCFNITGGFEGRLDAARHRGTVEGWKAAGLPWIQS